MTGLSRRKGRPVGTKKCHVTVTQLQHVPLLEVDVQLRELAESRRAQAVPFLLRDASGDDLRPVVCVLDLRRPLAERGTLSSKTDQYGTENGTRGSGTEGKTVRERIRYPSSVCTAHAARQHNEYASTASYRHDFLHSVPHAYAKYAKLILSIPSCIVSTWQSKL